MRIGPQVPPDESSSKNPVTLHLVLRHVLTVTSFYALCVTWSSNRDEQETCACWWFT